MVAREVLLRALYDAEPKMAGDDCPPLSDEVWERISNTHIFLRTYPKRVDAILAALAANQLAVVPREPTNEMLFAGTKHWPHSPSGFWRAMFDAISPSTLPTGE